MKTVVVRTVDGVVVEHTVDGIAQDLGNQGRERVVDQLSGGTRSVASNPSKLRMVRSAAGAAVSAIRNPKPASKEEQARRLGICLGCEFFLAAKNRCGKCGCFLAFKTKLAAWHCPVGKW